MIKKYVKIPQTVAGLMPILVLPLLGTLISGLIFYYVLGSLVAMINGAITDFLVGMSDSSGLILGGLLGLMRIDMAVLVRRRHMPLAVLWWRMGYMARWQPRW